MAEYFGVLVPDSIEKRRDKWLENLALGFKALKEQFDNLQLEEVLERELFTSTFIQASRHAISNHNQENLLALRNIILNAALPSAPDEIRQKIFVDWAGELTAWHICILRVFKEEDFRIPCLDLDSPNWRKSITTDEIAQIIEDKYSEMKGNYALYMQIIGDLHSLGLLTNILPKKDMMAKNISRPVLSPIANDFWKFITSPIPEENVG